MKIVILRLDILQLDLFAQLLKAIIVHCPQQRGTKMVSSLNSNALTKKIRTGLKLYIPSFLNSTLILWQLQWITPTLWLTQIRFTQISLTRIYLKDSDSPLKTSCETEICSLMQIFFSFYKMVSLNLLNTIFG